MALEPPKTDLKPVLQALWPAGAASTVTAPQIAEAISHFFTNEVTEAQTASLLICLHFTGLDMRADVLAACARAMLDAAAPVDVAALKEVVVGSSSGSVVVRKEGAYGGGLCDIVGTGGDSHNTFNISTTASIVASALLRVAKHGNRASTSKSGSADMVACMRPRAPKLEAVRPDSLGRVYGATNYAFLFAPVFHPGMRHVAPIRRQLPWRTVFNNLGPLANPLDALLEARVVGVARRELGPAFAEALRIAGARKALVVCGAEELDEISCAGPTFCWQVKKADEDDDDDDDEPGGASGGGGGGGGGESKVSEFTISPEDFGMRRHELRVVEPGKEPKENAEILWRILHGELADDEPLMEFVLVNSAALFVASGICEADESNMGDGDDGKVIMERGPGGERWKEGVRRAKWAIKSGEAWRQWEAFVKVTNEIGA